MTYPFQKHAEEKFKITPTGDYVRCVGGDTEMFRVEPYLCIKCGKIISGEFAGEYAGLKAAELAKKNALSLPCLWCMVVEARNKALDIDE